MEKNVRCLWMFSTCDHIFGLNVLIKKYILRYCIRNVSVVMLTAAKRSIMCPYSFHSWYKLLASGINVKILNVVKSLYSTAKSAVKQNNCHSVFFNCEIGVRQGDNLSPLLFALYLNDLQEHLAMAYNGLASCNLIQEWV